MTNDQISYDPPGQTLTHAPFHGYAGHFMPQHGGYQGLPADHAHNDEFFDAFLQPMDMHGSVHAPVNGLQAPSAHWSGDGGHSSMACSVGPFDHYHQQHYQPWVPRQMMPPTPPYTHLPTRMSNLQVQAATGAPFLPPVPKPALAPKPDPTKSSTNKKSSKRKNPMMSKRVTAKVPTTRKSQIDDEDAERKSKEQIDVYDSDTDEFIPDAEYSSGHITKRRTRAAVKASVEDGDELRSSSDMHTRGETSFKTKSSASPGLSTTCISPKGSGKIRKTRKSGPNDPDNIRIYHLRRDEFMGFEEIGNVLKEQYASLGQPAPSDFSQAAVYGRFVRNAPKIAKRLGQSYTRDDYLHYCKNQGSLKQRGGRVATAHMADAGILTEDDRALIQEELEAAVVNFTADEDQMLKSIFEDVSTDLWGMVAERMEESTGKTFERQVVARRFSTHTTQQWCGDER